MENIRKILVPIDFSHCAMKALEYAAFLSSKFDASVEALHVWEPPQYILPDSLIHVPGEPSQSLSEFMFRKAKDEMDSFIGKVKDKFRGKLQARIENGEAFETILRISAEGAFDLIVMGTHGRTGFSHFVLGSVAERVVRKSHCPVLTLRAEEKKPA